MDVDSKALKIVEAVLAAIDGREFRAPVQRTAAAQCAAIEVLNRFEEKPLKRPTAVPGLIQKCPRCGSGDVEFCHISVRPYCRECNHWGAVNFGTVGDAVRAWNAALKRSARERKCVRAY